MCRNLVKSVQKLMTVSKHLKELQRQREGVVLSERELTLLSIINQHEEEGIGVQATAGEFNAFSPNSISGSTVSIAISELWDQGYVDKVISRNNPRATTLRLTKKGKTIIKKDQQCDLDRLKVIIDTIPAEERDKLSSYVKSIIVEFEHMIASLSENSEKNEEKLELAAV